VEKSKRASVGRQRRTTAEKQLGTAIADEKRAETRLQSERRAHHQGGNVQADLRKTGIIAVLVAGVVAVGCAKKDNYAADTSAAVTDTMSTSTMTASSTAPMAPDTTASTTTTSQTTTKKSSTKTAPKKTSY
jgi:hypothetical protein